MNAIMTGKHANELYLRLSLLGDILVEAPVEVGSLVEAPRLVKVDTSVEATVEVNLELIDSPAALMIVPWRSAYIDGLYIPF